MGRKHHIRTTRRLSFLSRAFIKPSQTVDVPLTREAARHGLDHFTLHDAYNISLALRGHSTFERFALGFASTVSMRTQLDGAYLT